MKPPVLSVTLVVAIGIALLGAGSAGAGPVAPDELGPPDRFFRAQVLAVERAETRSLAGAETDTQYLRIRLTSGPGRGQVVPAEHSFPAMVRESATLRPGDAIVAGFTLTDGRPAYYVADRDRMPAMGVIALIFIFAAVAFSGRKGAAAIVGLGISLLVLARFVVPRILAGGAPLAVSLAGALLIAVTSIYFAHGLGRRTSVAVAGTLITLALAGGLSVIFVRLAGLSGTGSDEAFYLSAGLPIAVNFRGLLLGGIILGTLGVLDDITTSQAAVVDELSRANPVLPARELFVRGLSVGQEHIAALINTLVLAYAGASLPLFLLFALDRGQPLWVTINSEFVAEEIVRALVGSLALVLAVPITTGLAARVLRHKPGSSVPPRDAGRTHHGHAH
jgi:uncharacterized membrane protein